MPPKFLRTGIVVTLAFFLLVGTTSAAQRGYRTVQWMLSSAEAMKEQQDADYARIQEYYAQQDLRKNTAQSRLKEEAETLHQAFHKEYAILVGKVRALANRIDSRRFHATQWLNQKRNEFYEPLNALRLKFITLKEKIFASPETSRQFQA